ncbi:MAG: hypothetical protein ACJ74Z_10675 [Bryobacteraceae bacterium]
MELLLKRNEKWGALGKRYDLFAKIELKPEEQALMRKAKPEKVVIWEDDYATNNFRWRLMLLPAAIGAIIFGVISALIHPLLVLPVMVIAWFTLRKVLFNQVTGNITVADILTGRTVHCKSLDELLVKENEIREKIKNYCGNLETWHSLGNEQRINLNQA